MNIEELANYGYRRQKELGLPYLPIEFQQGLCDDNKQLLGCFRYSRHYDEFVGFWLRQRPIVRIEHKKICVFIEPHLEAIMSNGGSQWLTSAVHRERVRHTIEHELWHQYQYTHCMAVVLAYYDMSCQQRALVDHWLEFDANRHVISTLADELQRAIWVEWHGFSLLEKWKVAYSLLWRENEIHLYREQKRSLWRHFVDNYVYDIGDKFNVRYRAKAEPVTQEDCITVLEYKYNTVCHYDAQSIVEAATQ